MIRLLIKEGAFIDARDSQGRTPAFLATKNTCDKALIALLLAKANCWIQSYSGQRPIDIAASRMSQNFIRHSMLLSKMLKWVPKARFTDVWHTEAEQFFKM